MLQWMFGVSRVESIRDIEIRKRAGLAYVSDKMSAYYDGWSMLDPNKG